MRKLERTSAISLAVEAPVRRGNFSSPRGELVKREKDDFNAERQVSRRVF